MALGHWFEPAFRIYHGISQHFMALAGFALGFTGRNEPAKTNSNQGDFLP